jgi:D-sedoheptulose 7-phosphate isomerase
MGMPSTSAGPLRHLDALCERHPALAPIRGDIERAFTLLERCFRSGGQLLLCGNGGSAADCEHWAGELLKGFERHRPIPSGHGLPEDLAKVMQQGLPAIPLTGFPALRSAVANDLDPRVEFAQLAWALGRKGDVLAAISTSGNAKNVLAAAQAAKAKGMAVLSLTGAKGGQLAPLADVAIRAPEGRTCLAQELHLPIYHALCLMVEDALFA